MASIDDLIADIMESGPEFGPLNVRLQSLDIRLFTEKPLARYPFESLEIQVFSSAIYRRGSRKVEFRPPVADFQASIPAVLFSLEQKSIRGIYISDQKFVLSSDDVTLEIPFGDTPYESIMIGGMDVTEKFIL